MKISIALCTYNGAKYLIQQLESLCAQTLKADEVIACDDNSSDNTAEILNEYRDKLNIKLVVNKENLGVAKNFEQAISLCSGDIIFLCDQDDVWDKDKIKIMSEKMIEEKTGICCCDGIVADENLKQINSYTLWNTSGLSKIDLNTFSPYSLINSYYFTGMALCFRRNFMKYFMPINENAVHDEWIAFIISCFSKVSFVNQTLVVYRQHSEQKIGIILIKSLKEIWKFLRSCKIADMEKKTKKCEDLVIRLKQLEIETNLITAVENKIKHLKRRTSRSKFRFFILMAELISGQYKKYSNGTYTVFLKDLFSGR